MLQIFPIALREGDKPEKSLNEIRRIYSLFRENKITKKIYRYRIKSLTVIVKKKMLSLSILKIVKLVTRIKYFNLSDKTNLKRSNNYVALSNLRICNIWKNIRKLYKNNNFKVSTPA